jgi:hypothetical protein
MLTIPETYAAIILKRIAQRLRKDAGYHDRIRIGQLSLEEIVSTCLLRPVKTIATEPVLDLMYMYVVLIYAMLCGFLFAYPVIFGTPYGFNNAIIGQMFIPILIGAGFAPVIEGKFRDLCAKRKAYS